MTLNRILIFSAFAFIAGCASADPVKALEEKVTSLEEKVEAGAAAAASGGKTAAPKDEKAEKAAAALYEEIVKALRDGDSEVARAKFGELKAKYGTTTAYRRARKIQREHEEIVKAIGEALLDELAQ